MFEKMSGPDDVRGEEEDVVVVSFRALLAMKLFALKDDAARNGKDLLDLRALLAYGKGRISDDEFRMMCGRYATPSAYETIKAST